MSRSNGALPIDELREIMKNYKAADGQAITRRWLAQFYGASENTVHKWFMKTGKTRFTLARLETLKVRLGLMKPPPPQKAVRIRA